MRISKFLALALLAAIGLSVSACDDDHHHNDTIYIQDGVLFNTPPGGEDFGNPALYEVLEASETISDIDDADGYDFFLNDAALLMISVVGFDGLDPLVELYDPDGNFVAGDEGDFSESQAAILVGDVDPGLYTVVVWSAEFGGSGNGRYDLAVTISDDHGGDLGVIDANSAQIRNMQPLGSNGATASWAFTISEDSALSIDLEGEVGVNFDLQILDEQGFEVDRIENAGEVLDYDLAVLFAGTYMIIIADDDGSPASLYDLTIGAAAIP